MSKRFALAVAVALAAVAALWWLRPLLDLDSLRASLGRPHAYTLAHPFLAAALYVLFYVAFAALSLPGVWVVSVGGGALFGAWAGPPLVCLSYTLGATLAMSAARYWLRDAISARWPDLSARVDRGIASGGAHWLFAARLTPVIPYFAINLAVGLTRMRLITFAVVTALGAMPFALIYATAGAELGAASRPADMLNARMAAALLALGLAPFAFSFAARAWRRRAGQAEAPSTLFQRARFVAPSTQRRRRASRLR